jgi:radical SAM superfamily enzyme YgiQ (UPF0313 family)
MVAMAAPLDVILAGLSPSGDECLGLEYVARALRDGGHRPRVVTFGGPLEIDAAAKEVMRRPPPLVGLSLLSGASAATMVALAIRLRALGFAGHVTCGGTFATLGRARLLETQPSIDSIVRHDGELPMVALADALSAGRDPGEVAGLTTRDGDGPPAPVGSCAPLVLEPCRRSARPRYAGVASAKISATRGCYGVCRYCGLKGLRREAVAEARRAGLDGDAVRARSIGDLRRRSTERVADEMAHLYHELGVRFFHLVDENFLPRDRADAVAAVMALERALARRKVGPRAIGMMLRADAATPEAVEALTALGLVRALLGVESATDEGLRQLGRRTTTEDNARAMELLARGGVAFHFNVMLIHPDSTLAAIGREIGGLHRVSGGLLDPFQVEVFEGTDLFERLRGEGRLEGGPFLWHAWPREEGAARFARVFFRLRHEALGTLHMTPFAYEVLGELAVARRLGRLRRRALGAIARDADHLVEAHSALWLALLEEALDLARGAAPRDEVDAFLRRAAVRSARLTLRFDRLRARIERAATADLRSETLFPATARAAAVALAILGASACGARTGLLADADADVASDGSDADDARDADPDPDVEIDPCDLYLASDRFLDIERALEAVGADCWIHCGAQSYDFTAIQYVLDREGHVVDIVTDTPSAPVDAELKRCILEALAGQTFPCPELTFWHDCMVYLW